LRIAAKVNDAELAIKTEQLVKVSSADVIERVSNAVRGIQIRRLEAPPGLPHRAGSQYFDLGRSGPHWDQIVRSLSVGVFIPTELVGAEPELLVG
jgi:predicted component of type VI protein secretion system